MKTTIVLVLLTLGFSRQEADPRIADYFPLGAGAEWTFKETWTAKKDGSPVGWGPRTREEFDKEIEKFNCNSNPRLQYPPWLFFPSAGKNTVTFKSSESGITISYQEGVSIGLGYKAAKDGIRLASKTISLDGKVRVENRIEESQLFLKDPVKVGDKWTYGQFKAEWLAPEEIEVKAGKFTCLKVELREANPDPRPVCNIIGKPGTIVLWFAKGKGLVKETWTSDFSHGPVSSNDPPSLQIQTRELIEFKPGK